MIGDNDSENSSEEIEEADSEEIPFNNDTDWLKNL